MRGAASSPGAEHDGSAPADAGVDHHTGCLNESAVAARLDEEIARAGRHGSALSCLLLALDDLDAIALRYGTAMSEQALGHVGAVLRSEFRRFDRVADNTGEVADKVPDLLRQQRELLE